MFVLCSLLLKKTIKTECQFNGCKRFEFDRKVQKNFFAFGSLSGPFQLKVLKRFHSIRNFFTNSKTWNRNPSGNTLKDSELNINVRFKTIMKRKTRQQDKFEEEEQLKVRAVKVNIYPVSFLQSVIEIRRENFQFYESLTWTAFFPTLSVQNMQERKTYRSVYWSYWKHAKRQRNRSKRLKSRSRIFIRRCEFIKLFSC